MGSIYRDCLEPRNAYGRIPNSSVTNPCNNDDDTTPVVASDYFDGVYEYIKQMLMAEDDLEHRPCMFQDCSALQACEKYFYDALSDPQTVSQRTLSENNNPDSSGFAQWSVLDDSQPKLGSPTTRLFRNDFDGLLGSPGSGFLVPEICADNCSSPRFGFGQEIIHGEKTNSSNEDSNRKKNHSRDGDNTVAGCQRSTKQLASFIEEVAEPTDAYDKAFLCEKMNPGFYNESPDALVSSGDEVETKYKKPPEAKRGRPKGSTKKRAQQQQQQPPQRNNIKEVVDLRTLLTRCAQAVSSFNHAGAQEMLAKIRQHSSSYGDANERLAHCFANALEARVAGTGSMLYAASASRRVPASELLRAYKTYVTACPFKRMSNIFANKTIAGHTREADKIHIVDFGILYGFQWPCIIQGISLRPGGPPVLKITGIDFPQPGFKPAERIEQTGRRLASYCKRFNVPFQFNAIAKKWEDVTIDDLNLEPDETLVVNCLYRLRHVPDESTGADTDIPRDAVLKLINKLKPCIFVHGVVNGTYNAPFFTTRFREALYHYSSFFDMMEATLPREDPDRLMYEREVFGRDVMNVIACEGSERVDRPESYKQWQVRNRRAGFRKVPLNREIMEEVKIKVRKGYQCDYMVEEDSEWMLQGWKGRALYALSCWKPED